MYVDWKHVMNKYEIMNTWKYIKDFPYWERFKRDTYYFFHPIAHERDLKRYFKSGAEDDADYSYKKNKGKKDIK